VGEALVRSLCVINDHHRRLELARRSNGDFTRSSWPRGTSTLKLARRREQTGSLTAALLAAPSDSPSWSERLYLGIPALGDETAIAGALLIRLFATAEGVDMAVSFEYLPWAPRHLRYRLRYAVGDVWRGQHKSYRFLHGQMTEKSW
jgi:hypothetical protein